MTINNWEKQPIFLLFNRVRKEKALDFPFIFAILFTVSLIGLINVVSLMSFVLFLLISVGVYRLLFDRNIKKIVGLFVFYSLIAITLYLLQYATYPEYKGFTGGLGIGTDDARYFAGALGYSPISASIITYDLENNTFTTILRIIAKILPLKDIHLLNLLFFNVFGVAFIPIFTSRVAYVLTEEKKIADLAYKFAMICPIIMSNGLVLVRDGWTAVLFIGAIYFLLSKRYILLAATSAVLFYLRIASGVLLMIAVVSLSYYQLRYYRSDYVKKVLLFLLYVVVILSVSVVLFPIVKKYGEGKRLTENIIFREYFIETFLAQSVARKGESSIFYTIYTKPFYLRIPIGSFYFLCTPFLSIRALSFHGTYIPRAFLVQSFSILFLFYFKYLMQAVMYIWKNEKLAMRTVTVTFFISLLILSQLSLQFRHKTMIMPLFYILVAYGFYNKTKLGEVFGIGGALSLAFVQFAVNIIRIFE